MFSKRLLIVLLLLLPTNSFAADSTIASLTAASALGGTELFYCIQSGDKKCTAAQIGTYILTSPTITGVPVIPTPFTLGAISVTSTGTQLNYLNAATGTTGTASTNIVFSTSPVLVTPNLGTPSTLVLTNATGTPSAITLTNGTGLPVAGITGLGTGVGTWLGTPSSANLAAAITDETGSGVLVFGTTPTLATPVINGVPTGTGVASANTVSTLVARDGSGNFSAGTITATLSGAATSATTATTATNATNTAITDDTTTNATMLPTWVTTSTGNLPQKTTSTKLTFNPSTGVLSSTSFTGAGTGLTGTAASLTASTVTTNANLTGVITSSGNATSIASQTGTGTKFVVDTSPSIISPTITTSFTATGLVTNASLASMTTSTIKGQTVGGSGAPVDLTATQAAAIIGSVGGALKSKIITVSRDLTAATGSVAYTGMGFLPTTCFSSGEVGSSLTSYVNIFGMVDSSKTAVATNLGVNTIGTTTHFIGLVDATGSNFQIADVSTYDADGLTLSWTKAGTPTGTATIYVMCYR